jgi:hypothetical protein
VRVSPKVLQRTLRFQGFLALAQAGTIASGRRGADGMAGLAVDVGYADQAHLSRECLRLTGLIYEHSGHWGGGGPHPTAPLFVLSHRPGVTHLHYEVVR